MFLFYLNMIVSKYKNVMKLVIIEGVFVLSVCCFIRIFVIVLLFILIMLEVKVII